MGHMKFATSLGMAWAIWIAAQAQPGPPTEEATLFLNVRVFDGKSPALSPPSSVLVKGNTIELVSRSPIDPSAIENVTVVNGKGRVLMPGLIDAHWHAFM